jgi:hypothetical protein
MKRWAFLILVLVACSAAVITSVPITPALIVSPATLNITAGDSAQFTTNSTTPVVWSSSDTALATISTTGMLHAKAVGSVVVKATN